MRGKQREYANRFYGGEMRDALGRPLAADSCGFNNGVVCPKNSRTTPCGRCGWNPEVERQRLKEIWKRRLRENVH